VAIRICDVTYALQEDAVRLDPRDRPYSPLGISYGFCADILSHMTVDRLLAQPAFGLTLEDMFVSRGSLENKRARAEGWKMLPQREGEREHFDHCADWAAQMFARTTSALHFRVKHKERANASDVANAQLFVVPQSGINESVPSPSFADAIVVAQEHCVTSDRARALSTGRHRLPEGTDCERQERRQVPRECGVRRQMVRPLEGRADAVHEPGKECPPDRRSSCRPRRICS